LRLVDVPGAGEHVLHQARKLGAEARIEHRRAGLDRDRVRPDPDDDVRLDQHAAVAQGGVGPNELDLRDRDALPERPVREIAFTPPGDGGVVDDAPDLARDVDARDAAHAQPHPDLVQDGRRLARAWGEPEGDLRGDDLARMSDRVLELQAAHRRPDVASGHAWLDGAFRLEQGLAIRVAVGLDHLRLAGQDVLVELLHAVLAGAVAIDEADELRREGAVRAAAGLRVAPCRV